MPELEVWLCPVHESLDKSGALKPLDNCVGCLRAERDELRSQSAALQSQNQRLHDLVRYKRSELLADDLISMEEYAELAQDHAAVARLEGYDGAVKALQAKLTRQPLPLPSTYVRCMSGHYYAETRGDEECPTCEQLRALRERNTELEAQIADWHAKDMCDVCGGNGTPVSGKPCICGGSGSVRDAFQNIRRDFIDVHQSLDRALERNTELEALKRLIDGPTEPH